MPLLVIDHLWRWRTRSFFAFNCSFLWGYLSWATHALVILQCFLNTQELVWVFLFIVLITKQVLTIRIMLWCLHCLLQVLHCSTFSSKLVTVGQLANYLAYSSMLSLISTPFDTWCWLVINCIKQWGAQVSVICQQWWLIFISCLDHKPFMRFYHNSFIKFFQFFSWFVYRVFIKCVELI